MLAHLLFASPRHKLIPVATSMNNTKAMYSIDCLIHDFQSSVSLTHQALSEQVYTVAHMTRSDIDVNVFVGKLFTAYGRVVVGPVAPANIVLYWYKSRVLEVVFKLTRQ